MDNNTQEFSTKQVLKLLWRHKYFIGIFTIIITVVCGVYIYSQPVWYAAKTNVVPPKKSSSGLDGALSSVSSALKDIGMAKIGGKSSDAYTLMAVFQSRTLEDSVIKKFDLGKVYDIPDSCKEQIRKEYESKVEINLEIEGNYTITAWHKDKQKAADMANYIVEALNDLSLRLNQSESKTNKEYLESKIANTDSTIKKISAELQKYSSSKMIFAPLEQSKSIAGALSELKAEYLKQEMAYDLAKNNYGENDPIVINQKKYVQQLKEKINLAENQPGFAGNFAIKDVAGVGINYMSLYAEIEAFTKLKTFMLPMLEQARLDEIRDTKELLVLDTAIPPEKKDKPKRSVFIMGGFIGSLLTSILLVLMKDALIRFKQFMKSE